MSPSGSSNDRMLRELIDWHIQNEIILWINSESDATFCGNVLCEKHRGTVFVICKWPLSRSCGYAPVSLSTNGLIDRWSPFSYVRDKRREWSERFGLWSPPSVSMASPSLLITLWPEDLNSPRIRSHISRALRSFWVDRKVARATHAVAAAWGFNFGQREKALARNFIFSEHFYQSSRVKKHLGPWHSWKLIENGRMTRNNWYGLL